MSETVDADRLERLSAGLAFALEHHDEIREWPESKRRNFARSTAEAVVRAYLGAEAGVREDEPKPYERPCGNCGKPWNEHYANPPGLGHEAGETSTALRCPGARTTFVRGSGVRPTEDER